MQLDSTEARTPATSPERRLIAAIIAQSVDDLTNPDSYVRSEARRFWSASTGATARHRRRLLELLDIDDTVACQRIAHLLEDDAVRPSRYIDRVGPPIHKVVLDAMPNGEMTIAQIIERCPSFDVHQVRSAITQLRDKDLVRVTCKKRGGSLYAKTSWIMDVMAA